MVGTRLAVGEATAVDAVPGVDGDGITVGLSTRLLERAARGTTATGAGGGARSPPNGVRGLILRVDGEDCLEASGVSSDTTFGSAMKGTCKVLVTGPTSLTSLIPATSPFTVDSALDSSSETSLRAAGRGADGVC